MHQDTFIIRPMTIGKMSSCLSLFIYAKNATEGYIMTKLSKKQQKKMSRTLGVSAKELDAVMQDLQKMELLRHVAGNLWEVHNGIRWHEVRI